MIEKFHIIPHPLFNGNNTETIYNYTPSLRRLNNLNVKTSDGNDLFNNKYEFDKVGNVTSLLNTAGITANDMAGNYSHNFKYDEFNRLAYAEGNFEGSNHQLETGNDANSKYALKMQYNTTHGIVTKTQEHAKNGSPFMPNTYDNVYKYITDTHKVEAIVNNATGEAETFKYDANGNITVRNDNNAHRELFWDESNRLRVVSDNHSMQHYIYDGSGERVLKANSDMEAVYENGELVNAPGTVSINGYTSYPSAFIVITADGVYSKHYYAGTQRIVSRLGDNDAGIFETGCSACKQQSSNPFEDSKLKQAQIQDLNLFAEMAKKGTVSLKEYKPVSLEEQEKAMATDDNRAYAPPSGAGGLYYYHPDHLGTSTALTDFNGNAYQFFLNLPFGETMAQQLGSNYYNSPFKFNGKELDEETGFYYYGARYYDPKISLWLTVDPLAEKFPNWNPYNYTMQNPINLIDPSGMEPEEGGGDPSASIGCELINYKAGENYSYMAVIPSNYKDDWALTRDYNESLNAGVPIMIVDHVGGFSRGLDKLKGDGANINTFVFTSHGNEGFFDIGTTRINLSNLSEKNGGLSIISGLKGKLEDKTLIILACNTGKGSKGEIFTQEFAKQTKSTVITSQHTIMSGLDIYNGSSERLMSFSPNERSTGDKYRISYKGSTPETIFDLSLNKNNNSTTYYHERQFYKKWFK